MGSSTPIVVELTDDLIDYIEAITVSLSERTAKASEQVAANTKQLVDQAKLSRLIFTA